MNQGGLSPKELKPETFMEEAISNMTKASEGINSANSKLEIILIRLRGNIPTEDNKLKKDNTPNCHIEAARLQLSSQNIMLNYLHNMLDELTKLI